MQTFNPDNPVLRYAVNYDYSGFFNRENSIRKTTSFPPYSVIVRVMVEDEDETRGLEVFKEVYFRLNELYEQNKDDFLFFNKMKSPIKKLKNKYRFQVLMRVAYDKSEIIDKIYELSLPLSTPKTLCYVEINPTNLS